LLAHWLVNTLVMLTSRGSSEIFGDPNKSGYPVVGTWECVSTTPDDADLHWTLTVTESDGKLSATATGETGDSNLNDVTFDGKVLSFTATLDSGTYTVNVNVAGDKMEGTWSGAGDSGKVTGSRKKS
jgi:hypothetical protein